MTTNQLGIRNSNIIVPYQAATKQTKQLSLVKTTDITAAVVAGTALDSSYTVNTSVKFYADSAGVWKMNLQGKIAAGGAGSNRTGVVLTFVKSSIKFSSVIQGLGVAVPSIGTSTETSTTANSNTITIYTSSATATAWTFTIDLLLEQEPTDYTIPANMEVVLPVSVYIPPASAGIAGLVNNVVGNTAGTPILGKTDGQAVASGHVGATIEFITTTAVTGSTTAGTYTTAVTLPNLPKGKWRLDYIIPRCNIEGISGDTGNIVYGRLFRARILKNGVTSLTENNAPGMAKSTVNSGYFLTSISGYALETNTADTDDYELQFTSIHNSGASTITACDVSGSTGSPIKLTATRLA